MIPGAPSPDAAAPPVPRGAAAPCLAVSLAVVGAPAPQGSKRTFTRTTRAGRSYTNTVESSQVKVTAWRLAIAQAAQSAGCAGRPLDGAVRAVVSFYLPRPLSHYGRGRNAATLRPDAPQHPSGYPDVDKLARSTLDGLAGARVLANDSQVTQLHAGKFYADRGQPSGALIEIFTLEGP